MDQTEVIDRDDRRQALDTFANAGSNAPLQPMSQLVKATGSVVDRIIGAQQVAVYRDETRILQKLAALGAAAGSDWFYRFPVKNKRAGTTDWIEGPSIKLANDVARIYGNCCVEVREIDVGDAWVFYARLTDIETGFSTERAYRQRKSQSSMNTANDRALDIAYQIGQSKAIRNVITNGLQTFCDYAFEAARNSLVDRIGKELPRWRDRTIDGLVKIPVELPRAEAVIGRAAKDWTAPDVAKVIAMMKAIADGMATVDETFPPKGEAASAETTAAETTTEGKANLDQFAGDRNAANKAQPQAGNDAQGNTAPVSPAGGQAASVSADAQPSQGKATQSEAAAGSTTATTATKETAKDDGPKNAAAYVQATQAWIENLTDADAGQKRWSEEKKLRNKLNVDPDDRDKLDAALKAKIASLRGSKG